ncbi:FmdB family zinc ribbon protein [Rhodoplanes sp. SY1]|uniref:FmdB family zinc ribbon protein n=1 Tax=Rhodoplanes sp. SY1 TaxID=3166646 RepID=UPI0038B4BB72
MPLYGYHCATCDKDFELLVRASDTPACPTCGSAALTRLVSRPAAEGRSKDLIRSARAQAAREGHFSHYGRSERPK